MKRRRSCVGGRPRLDVVVYEHPECSDHDTSTVACPHHQENAGRLTAIRERLERLEGVAFQSCFPPASRAALRRVHSEAYLEVCALAMPLTAANP